MRIRPYFTSLSTVLKSDDRTENMSGPQSREVKWTCQHCTLQNENFRKRCNACHQQRIHTEVTITENGEQIGGWTCTNCHFDNTIREKSCKKCQKRNKPVARLISYEEEFKVEKWHCKWCTFLNPETLYMCDMCEKQRDWQAGNTGTSDGATGDNKGKEKETKDKVTIGKGNDKDKITKGTSTDTSSKRNGKDNSGKNARKNDKKLGDNSESTDQWRCKICTFLNSQLMTEKCEMCDSICPSSVAVAAPTSRVAKRQRLQHKQSMRVVDLQRKEEADALKRWISITKYCREKKKKFTDADFPHDVTSLYTKPKKEGNNPQWRRCHDIYTGNQREKWVVYRDNPLPDDIEQGYLGNCWYLSALAVLADRKELLEKIILTKTFCDEGAYHLRLCKDGCWKIVLVDDAFPCDTSNRFLYSRGKRNQLWIPLIEKAAAKLFGCYQALASGHTVEALSLLTGEPCEHISFQDSEEGDKETDKVVVWSKLVNARESKLVRIRNPWGRESWNGDWSDGSQRWSAIRESSRKALNPTENKNGIFWISLDEYMKYFDSVDICKARSGWHEVRIKGVFPPNAGKPWKFVNLSIMERTQLDIGLFQKSFRGQEGKENTLDLFIVVMENNMEGHNVFKRVVTTSQRQQRSFVGCEVDLRPGYYTIVCLAFKHWQTAGHGRQSLLDEEQLNRNFVMAIHSSEMILSEEIDSHVPDLPYRPR
ncbi:calpain-D-like isoform X2 [Pecten maximus]|uniref:calpain-D-like isoform X2 n=1 Tax=Pecten maximus TaxID=6579 RepID=UPI00145802E5|nr:calpain-D-like isoform X2 [Pecten maximus]